MANNRLYIKDTKDGSELMLAKSFGRGWELWGDVAGRLGEWLELRDHSSFGNVRACKTSLVVICENDPEYIEKN